MILNVQIVNKLHWYIREGDMVRICTLIYVTYVVMRCSTSEHVIYLFIFQTLIRVKAQIMRLVKDLVESNIFLEVQNYLWEQKLLFVGIG